MPATNPFEYGRELNPDELVDRAGDVDAVAAAMQRPGKLFLIGPRRFGKTSIIRAAEDRVTAKGGVVLRYDAEAFTSVELLAGRILADTATRLTSTVERATLAMRDFFAGVRPTATYSATDNKWSVSLAGTAGRETGAPLLADVLNGVERAAVKARKTVAIVIDEFQQVVANGGRDAEAQIRASIQRHRRVGYVFAGSATRLLADMTSDPKRPFYKLGDVRVIGALPRPDFTTFLTAGFRSARIRVEPGAVDAILELAEEVPYNVQMLAHECWVRCREASPASALTAALVRDTRDRAALRYDPIYTQLWSALPPAQQKALLALLRERGADGGGAGLLSADVTRRYHIGTSTMQKSLEALTSKGILREDPALAESRLRIEDPLFAAWVELVVPR